MNKLNKLTTEESLNSSILKLKKEQNAILLAHYYQDPTIQDIADFLGDSLELAKQAARTNADLLIFAGVHFMAETAKILNPNKVVLLPDLNAGCSLADSCPSNVFNYFLSLNPQHLVISYINCSANVKSLSDIICTSANAINITNILPLDQKILFAPDQNLGKYIISKTGRDLLLWPGSCLVHETFSEKRILELHIKYPDAEIIAHPECEESILKCANFIGSTTALLKYVQTSSTKIFIVATEKGILHEMQKREAKKLFLSAPALQGCSCNECPFMKINTTKKLYTALINHSPKIELELDLIYKALLPVKRMLDLSAR
uniref:Quinolinate synthase n=1 Tax=Gloeochaete wittrockiana TaxID=38269 RepID=A0A3G1IW14_9EUKA|nr:quinolinate synthetase [Gloeochaete wittrockiana]ASQ40213.1 quinolinate synthetase [Gloeochaete wittrockiana]